jgi:predicted acyl esterase
MAARSEDASQPREDRLIVAKDVRIPLRDGTLLCGDVFRPDGGDERFPVIMNIGRIRRTSCGCRRPTSRRRRIHT